ncbi:hypothetical protein M422DRAFT_253997 [Sphaerobolus stellatus SS14]|uniref:Uncharacterized protein n=1 Tax=Sphaerobolus stellatus (strain SS14) TaxID=990650 RepID=A0A0C9V7B6_SPHS4|nr:hypothetical protein M422DRAFT_253997 [Sphaerobolus stellatus SS14]
MQSGRTAASACSARSDKLFARDGQATLHWPKKGLGYSNPNFMPTVEQPLCDELGERQRGGEYDECYEDWDWIWAYYAYAFVCLFSLSRMSNIDTAECILLYGGRRSAQIICFKLADYTRSDNHQNRIAMPDRRGASQSP